MTAGAGAVQLPVLIAGRVGCRLKHFNLRASALVQRCLPHLAWHRAAPGEGPGRPDAANQPPGIAVQMARLPRRHITNLINPNPLIFMVAFLPQFVNPVRGSVALQLLILGITQKATGFAILGVMALGAGKVQTWLARRPRILLQQRRFAALIMIVLAARLMFEGRPNRP
jgi:threonine/homoserine/homoserine lactone efflux protein